MGWRMGKGEGKLCEDTKPFAEKPNTALSNMETIDLFSPSRKVSSNSGREEDDGKDSSGDHEKAIKTSTA